MVTVPGVVEADSPIKMRIGPRIIDASSGTLAPGTIVTITGFAIDPRGDEFRHRLRIDFNGAIRWITALYVKVAPADTLQIPYVVRFPDDLVRELREGLGITTLTTAVPSRDDVEAIARFMSNLLLRGNNWDAAQLSRVRAWLEQLYALGVTLRSPGPGGWALTEIEATVTAILTTAQGMAVFLQSAYGLNDPALAFRALFAPLIVTRVNRDNVNNMSDSVWFAKNVQGYEVVFGNRVFFNGKSPTRRFPNLPFTSVELIAHEIAHVINYRYQLTADSGRDWPIDDFYMAAFHNAPYTLPTGEIVHVTGNNGFGFVARSSEDTAEIVTDAIANAALGRMTFASADPYQAKLGQARQLQLTDLMRRVIHWHTRHYTSLADIQARIDRIRLKNPQLADMTPALNAAAVGELALDNQMAILKAIPPLV